MSLTALSREEHNAEQREIIANTTYVIDEAIRSLREISNNLSPHVLNDFGLARGVQNFIDKSAAMHDVKIRFTTNLRGERYDTDIEVILYRVICELINNSLKHAACTEVNLSLSQNGPELALDYSDNGRGFNPQDSRSAASSLRGSIRWAGRSTSPRRRARGMRAAIRVNTQQGAGPCKSATVNAAADMERRIILVDDHSLFRNGLRGFAGALRGVPGCRRSGEAARSFWECWMPWRRISSSWIFAMPGLDGAQTTERGPGPASGVADHHAVDVR